MKRLERGLLLAALAALTAGCGRSTDGPDLVPVRGTVTVKGQPRGGLNLVFHPESGGRPATGQTNADGSFALTTFNTGDGAPAGTYHVAVTAAPSEDEAAAASPPMPGFPGYKEWMQAQKERIDPKYADPTRSGLTYTVPKEGLKDVEIKIP